MVNNIAVIRVLGDVLGDESVNALVNLSKVYLGWNDFVADFSKHTSSTLLTDLFEKTRQWNLKQMQFQDTIVLDTYNKAHLSSLLHDAQTLSEQREEIENQLLPVISELITLILSNIPASSGGSIGGV